jgi:uncharacterized membrane protein
MKRAEVLLAIGAAFAAAFLFPDIALHAARAAGYSVCHQWPEHSFAIGGVSLPLCARCTGTYFGALAALGLIWAVGRGKAGDWPPRIVLAVLAIGFAWMVVDGANSFADALSGGALRLYPPTNALRFLAGGLNGMALIGVGYPLFSRVMWAEWAHKSMVRNLGEVAALWAILAAGAWALLTGAGVLLPLFSLLSLAGILVLFTGANAALWLILARKEGLAATLTQALPGLGAGLLMTVGELLLIRVARSLVEQHFL